MNTPTRHRFLGLALATLALIGAAALAQDTPPESRSPAATSTERPADETPAADATPPTPGAETATSEANTDSDDTIVWTRERRPWSGGRHHFRRSDDTVVSVGGDSRLGSGQRADSVVSVFGSSTSAGDVSDAVVSVFGDTRVEDGRVGEAAVAVLGNTYINAVVDGSAVAVLGNIELGPKADVRGDVVVVGGTLTRDPAAILRGGVQHVMSVPAGALNGLRAWIDNCVKYLRPLAFAPGLSWVWTLALGFLVLYALIALMFREPLDRCVRTLQEYPGQTVIASLLAMLLAPVVFVVLAITVVGALAIPLVGFAIFIATLFGKAVVLAWIGRSFLKLLDDGERLHSAGAVLVGGVAMLALYLVPVLGFLVYNLLGILALGVVAYTALRSLQARRRNTPPPAPAAGGAGPGPVAPGGGASPDASTMGSAAFAGNTQPGAASASGAAGASFADIGGATTNGDTSGSTPNGEPRSGYAGASGVGGAAFTASTDPTGGSGNGTPGGAYVPPGSGGAQPTVNEILAYPRAGFWIRMLALLIDTIIIGVAVHILSDHDKLHLIALAAYGAIMWKTKGTTIGGIVCNLKVVRLDGRPIDWSTSMVRALSCFLSLVVAFLGFIWIAFDEGKQAWHDKIAGTAVVRPPQGVSLL